MRINAFRVLASSLAFNSAAVANVCKPKPSASISLSISTSETSRSTLIPVSTLALTYGAYTTSGTFIDTTTFEIIVSTDATSSTESSIVASATSTEPSTETVSTTAIISDSSDTTTEIPTSTSMTTSSATTSVAPPPLFNVITTRRPTQPITSDRKKGHPLSYPTGEESGYTTGFFAIDPLSGHLLLDNTLPICAFYGIEDTNPSLGVCPTFLSQQTVLITCQIHNGNKLDCAAPMVHCSQNGEDVECENLGSEFNYVVTTCNEDTNFCGIIMGDAELPYRTQMVIYYA